MTDSNTSNLPHHIGIIMDGNGRWAKSRGLPRVSGHSQGAKTVDVIVTACRKLGINFLTLYAFSSQNWTRPSLEVQALMSLLSDYIRREREKILSNNIRLLAIGDLISLPDSTRKSLLSLIDASSENTGMTLTLALSYGGQEEIVSASKSIAQKVKSGEIDPDNIDIDLFSSHTWSHSLGPVDLIIRTSGELRVSNFLLWSGAYSEFYFSNKMWPEFTESDLKEALKSFQLRNRRFGDIG